jgi:50S ribosomal subunit-associated GTPase HflX
LWLDQVLEDLQVQDLPLVTAWNKVDTCPDPAAVKALAGSRRDTVAISGATGEGMTELLEAIAAKLAEGMAETQVGHLAGRARPVMPMINNLLGTVMADGLGN